MDEDRTADLILAPQPAGKPDREGCTLQGGERRSLLLHPAVRVKKEFRSRAGGVELHLSGVHGRCRGEYRLQFDRGAPGQLDLDPVGGGGALGLCPYDLIGAVDPDLAFLETIGQPVIGYEVVEDDPPRLVAGLEPDGRLLEVRISGQGRIQVDLHPEVVLQGTQSGFETHTTEFDGELLLGPFFRGASEEDSASRGSNDAQGAPGLLGHMEGRGVVGIVAQHFLGHPGSRPDPFFLQRDDHPERQRIEATTKESCVSTGEGVRAPHGWLGS